MPSPTYTPSIDDSQTVARAEIPLVAGHQLALPLPRAFTDAVPLSFRTGVWVLDTYGNGFPVVIDSGAHGRQLSIGWSNFYLACGMRPGWTVKLLFQPDYRIICQVFDELQEEIINFEEARSSLAAISERRSGG